MALLTMQATAQMERAAEIMSFLVFMLGLSTELNAPMMTMSGRNVFDLAQLARNHIFTQEWSRHLPTWADEFPG